MLQLTPPQMPVEQQLTEQIEQKVVLESEQKVVHVEVVIVYEKKLVETQVLGQQQEHLHYIGRQQLVGTKQTERQ